jgi:23S rRNA pseudouridine1911/1915/1917 synthase
MERLTCTVSSGLEEVMRLDRYAAECLKLFSRSQVKNRRLQAKVNGKTARLSKPVQAGDILELSWQSVPEETLAAEDIPLDILFENERVVVINKASGMAVHPGAGIPGGTVANALLFRTGPLDPGRAGLVHRLDKDTSGVLIAARDSEALAFLAAQFKARTVQKRYAAIVSGVPREPEGCIKLPLARDPRDRKRFAPAAVGTGKAAQTRYRLIRSWDGHAFLLIRPRTGRTHQIRVHLASLGCPVSGDPIYGRPHPLGLMLHAYSLEIILPGGETPSIFKAPLPPRFRNFTRSLNAR